MKHNFKSSLTPEQSDFVVDTLKAAVANTSINPDIPQTVHENTIMNHADGAVRKIMSEEHLEAYREGNYVLAAVYPLNRLMLLDPEKKESPVVDSVDLGIADNRYGQIMSNYLIKAMEEVAPSNNQSWNAAFTFGGFSDCGMRAMVWWRC